jgi:hypothetical protein
MRQTRIWGKAHTQQTRDHMCGEAESQGCKQLELQCLSCSSAAHGVLVGQRGGAGGNTCIRECLSFSVEGGRGRETGEGLAR